MSALGEVEIRVAGPADLDPVARAVALFRDHLKRRDPGDAALRAALPGVLNDPGTEFCLALAPASGYRPSRSGAGGARCAG